MRLTLCNEMLLPMSLPDQCKFASDLGYDGLEIAPFTLGENPAALPEGKIASIRQTVESSGLTVASLHWLALAPAGISLTETHPDAVRNARKTMARIVDLGAGLGARVLVVLGSPAQRRLGAEPERQRAVFIEHAAAMAERAGEAGLTLCIEAINRGECNFINTSAQVEAMIAGIGHRALKIMIDVSHAAQEESVSLAALARRHLESGMLAHVQLNAINRRAPGQSTDPEGRDDIAGLIATLLDMGYEGDCAMEPLDYRPDGPSAAALAIGHVRGLIAGLAQRRPA